MFAYIKYLFFSPMLFLNIHLLLSSEIPLNTQICLCLSYYKNYGKHYRYCYIIHFEIQYMHYKHTKVKLIFYILIITNMTFPFIFFNISDTIFHSCLSFLISVMAAATPLDMRYGHMSEQSLTWNQKGKF